jgi:hypothetical protein
MHLSYRTISRISCVLLASSFPFLTLAAPQAEAVALSDAGQKFEARYANALKSLRADVEKALPKFDARIMTDFKRAREAAKAAEKTALEAQQALGLLATAQALIGHAKGKWIGGAEKSIAAAEAALKKASTDAEREAANKEIAKWQANKEEGLKALKERQENYDKLKKDEKNLIHNNDAAREALAIAKAAEATASKKLLDTAGKIIASDTLDAKLMTCIMLVDATPASLAAFAEKSPEQAAMIDKLFADAPTMKQMLEAGGAKFGKYTSALEIHAAIQKISTKPSDRVLQRLALATSLEHAKQIEQTNAVDQTGAAATVDPVKRYVHYEKAYLAGELDAAFASLNTWQMRMVVGCDAPDEILTWGRQMLRTYRPDHIYNLDYGWRYASTVRTEVPYGSQNVQYDLPTLHKYQNIPKNGGVCGRRAFFGRFILQAFGIPTWGVTQHKHAALSHWTPKGWVVNFGAGFDHSWWDKDEVPRSGSDFLQETQARAHGGEYLKVQRAQWISRILGETQYNHRKSIEGGFWSQLAQYQAQSLASSAVDLGPLGKELAEANEAKVQQKIDNAKVAAADRKIVIAADGTITIPAVAHSNPAGSFTAMKSFTDRMQLHITGGYKAEYFVDVPQAGKYTISARMATLQDGQKLWIAANNPQQPIAFPVPYTVGLWQASKPIELMLAKGKNTLHIVLEKESRGVSVKEFQLKPAR